MMTDVSDIPEGRHAADTFIQRNMASLVTMGTRDACRATWDYTLRMADHAVAAGRQFAKEKIERMTEEALCGSLKWPVDRCSECGAFLEEHETAAGRQPVCPKGCW